MGTDEGRLWREVDQLLKRRPGWRFQARSTPGAPPAWCFGPEISPTLTVTVEARSIHVSVTGDRDDLTLAGSDELLAWLIDYWPGALTEQRVSRLGKLRRGRLFEWE